MIDNSMNPFSITKAVSFSNSEINQFWVELIDGRKEILNPKDRKPKYILGSKGCGKTHLMRYFSYSARKLKYKDTTSQLENDGYIGIYMLLGGLNSQRFSGKNIPDDMWKSVFQQYMETFILAQYIKILCSIKSESIINVNEELEAIKGINNVIISKKGTTCKTLDEFYELLNNILRDIDYEINNCVFTGEVPKIEIIANPGALLLEVPNILKKNISILKNVTVLFLLDELEKLFEYQKKFINTIVWENKPPCCIWIGARFYGFKTKKTYNEEELKEGSEYELLTLDDLYREKDSTYIKKAKELIVNRLQKSHYIDHPIDDIDSFFEYKTIEEIVQQISKESKGKTLTHHKDLKIKLKRTEFEDNKINKILKDLSFPKNLLFEKYNYFLLYQDWYKNKDLEQSAFEIKENLKKFIKGIESSRHENVEDKFKLDLFAQLTIETKNNAFLYHGLEFIIKMSWGNPRNLLTLLKLIFKWSVYNNKKPFQKDIISIDEQYRGIREGSQWYYNDAELTGTSGMQAFYLIDSIGRLLNAERFSNKPIECSPSAFYFNLGELSKDAKDYVSLVTDHAFLVEVGEGRIDRNLKYQEAYFQLHRMLSPLWFLPIYRRGSVKLNKELAMSIFSISHKESFKENFRVFSSKRNAPFKESSSPETLSLF